MALNVECPNCGSKSLIIGYATSTAMYCMPFTDEEGRVHNHNENIVMQSYSCKECGNDFSQQELNSCWCGWVQNNIMG